MRYILMSIVIGLAAGALLVGCGGGGGSDSANTGGGGSSGSVFSDTSGGGGYADSYSGAAGADTGGSMEKPLGPLADDASAPPSDAVMPAEDVPSIADASESQDAMEPSDAGPDEPEPEEPPATNPFTVAEHDPQSTFAVDVDTASYDIFRQRVNLGWLPDAALVRLEEFVNYFRYDYPTPTWDDETPFTISLGAAPCPFRETLQLRVGIQGREAPPKEIKPANLVFLVDVSGSMSSSNKLPLVKLVLRETLQVLDGADTVSIVTYAGSTRVALEPTAVSDRSRIEDVIDGLQAGGGTYGSGGIELAYEQAEDAYLEDGINHILLCTDGDFNIGVSGTSSLVELIEEKRRTGITLTVLGFGWNNLNDSMMEAITNAGNGIYAVISDADQAIDYVHDRMLSTLTFIAQDMKIQVEFNPAHVLAYRLLGYENRAIADVDFTNDKVDAGEIGAGHQVTALYDVVLHGEDIPEPDGAPAIEDGPASDVALDVAADQFVLVKVRWKDVGASEDDAAYQVDQGLAVEDVAGLMSDADPDLRWASAVAAFAEILKGSPFVAQEVLPTIESIIGDSAGDDADRLEFVHLFGLAVDLLNP